MVFSWVPYRDLTEKVKLLRVGSGVFRFLLTTVASIGRTPRLVEFPHLLSAYRVNSLLDERVSAGEVGMAVTA